MSTVKETLGDLTPAGLTQWGVGKLPGYLGIEVTSLEPLRARLAIRQEHHAPNGFLHAGTVVTLADTLCGYACVLALPEGATGFTTVELKANFLGTARAGALVGEATPVHLGRSTQVWDATVKDETTGKTIALFRCTQMVLMPR